jgi:O-antigen ligase
MPNFKLVHSGDRAEAPMFCAIIANFDHRSFESMTSSLWAARLGAWTPFGVYSATVYLFVLPFAHTIALRYLALLVTAVLSVMQWRYLLPPSVPAKPAFALWAMAIGMGVAVSPDFDYSIGEARVELLYAMSGFLAVYAFAYDRKAMLTLLQGLAAGALVLSLLAIFNYTRTGTWGHGYHGYLGNFSSSMLITLPLLALMVALTPAETKKLALLCAIVTAGAVLVAAGLARSRMFWITLAVMTAAYAVLLALGPLRRLRPRLILGGMLAALAIGTAGYVAVSQSKVPIVESDIRFQIWGYSLNRVAESPIVGHGYGRELGRSDYREQFPDLGILHPHNLVLSLLEQMGVVGVAAFMILFLSIGAAFWRLYRSQAVEASAIGAAGLVMLLGFLTKNMTDMFFVKEIALLFWGATGCLLGYGNRVLPPNR